MTGSAGNGGAGTAVAAKETVIGTGAGAVASTGAGVGPEAGDSAGADDSSACDVTCKGFPWGFAFGIPGGPA